MNNETSTKTHAAQKSKLIHLIISGIMLFIIISILLGYYHFITMQQQMTTDYKKLQKQYEVLQTNLQTIHNLTQQHSLIIENNQTIINDISQHLGQNKDELRLAETEYFIKMACLSLYVQHDIPTTIPLLKNALQCLKQSNLKYRNIIQLVTHHISALETLPPLNWQDIYSRLQAIDSQIELLPLLDEELGKPNHTSPNITTTESKSVWKNFLKKSWHQIQKVLVIRHDEEVVIPLLSAEQRGLLNLNLHLLIAQTQSALLQRQATIYQASLKQLQKMLRQYFSMESTYIKPIYSELTELQQINIAPKLPDLYKTLQAIQQVRTEKAILPLPLST